MYNLCSGTFENYISGINSRYPSHKQNLYCHMTCISFLHKHMTGIFMTYDNTIFVYAVDIRGMSIAYDKTIFVYAVHIRGVSRVYV